VTAKPVIPSPIVQDEVDAAIVFYLSEADEETALAFIAALESAYRYIGENPSSGSPRWGHILDLPGLRCWKLKRFPWLIFYIERPRHVDVVRFMHAKRDIPNWMIEDGN
jgi:toxin ParE1/3/4